MDISIKNGVIINAHDTFKADIGIQNGKIVAIGEDITGFENIDASGKYILPGLIEIQTQFESPFGNTRSIDNFFTGTRSAACGGVTTVLDVATPNRDETLAEAIKARKQLADPQVVIDYGLHAGITYVNDVILNELAGLVNNGIPSFECFMMSHDPAIVMDDKSLLKLLAQIGQSGGLLNIHCGNQAVLQYFSEQYPIDQENALEHYPDLCPPFSESEAMYRVLTFAEQFNSAVYITSVSSRSALSEVLDNYSTNPLIYAGTALHYLTHTADAYATPEGRNYVTLPPLRSKEDKASLWKGIRNGAVQIVSSAHRAFTQEQKKLGTDLASIPAGMATIETLLPVMYQLGVAGKHINLMQLVAVLSTNPAKIFGLSNKGSVSVGKDADLVIFDPTNRRTIGRSTLHGESDYCIYEGLEVQGYQEMTFSHGKIVYDSNRFTGEQGAGNFVPRSL